MKKQKKICSICKCKIRQRFRKSIVKKKSFSRYKSFKKSVNSNISTHYQEKTESYQEKIDVKDVKEVITDKKEVLNNY